MEARFPSRGLFLSFDLFAALALGFSRGRRDPNFIFFIISQTLAADEQFPHRSLRSFVNLGLVCHDFLAFYR
jgi:hypothetical protein